MASKPCRNRECRRSCIDARPGDQHCLIADPDSRGGFEQSIKPTPILTASQKSVAVYRYPVAAVDRPFTVEDQGGPPQQDVIVTYPIDWYLFGKRAAAMANAAIGIRASEADFADVVRQRVTEVALAFFDILEARGLLELARQDVENWQRLEEVMRKGAELGSKPKVEWNRIQLDLLNSRRMLRDAELAVVNATAKFRALLGRADAEPEIDASGSLDLPPAAELFPLHEAYELSVQNRPDLQALRVRFQQAGSSQRRARKAYRIVRRPLATPPLPNQGHRLSGRQFVGYRLPCPCRSGIAIKAIRPRRIPSSPSNYSASRTG